MERREFLKLCGVGLAGVAFIGGGLAGTNRAFAQEASSGPLRQEFESAAEEYGVPVEVLMAMGYVNTRWEMPPPATSDYEEGETEGKGTYGIMALVRNPTTDTLGDAAQLTGLSEAALKTDRAANIRGGAALLAEASGTTVSGAMEDFNGTVSGATEDLDATDPDSVDEFKTEVTGAADSLTQSLSAVRTGLPGSMAVAGVGGGELYVGQVRDTLASGATATISSGERVSLVPSNL
jgi:hypothetical protein